MKRSRYVGIGLLTVGVVATPALTANAAAPAPPSVEVTTPAAAPAAPSRAASASTSAVSNAAVMTPGQVHYFAIDSARNLRHYWRNDSGKLSTDVWKSGGMSDVRPTAITWRDNQYVFGITQNRELIARSWSPGGIGVATLGRGMAFTEVSAMRYENQLHVFARADGQLRHWWRDPGQGWKSDSWKRGPKGENVTGRPISYVWGNEQHVFARCAGDAVCHWWWKPGARVQTDKWAGPGSTTSDVTGFAWGGQQHVFYRNRSGKAAHVFWDSASKRLVRDTWPQPMSGTPTAVPLSDRQALVAKGPGGYPIVQYWVSGSRPSDVRNTVISGRTLAGVPSMLPHISNMTVLGRSGSGALGTWVKHASGGQSSGLWFDKIKTRS